MVNVEIQLHRKYSSDNNVSTCLKKYYPTFVSIRISVYGVILVLINLKIGLLVSFKKLVSTIKVDSSNNEREKKPANLVRLPLSKMYNIIQNCVGLNKIEFLY